MGCNRWSVRYAARVRRAWESRGQWTEERDVGFTLIELMVVLLIMGILMAIAIPAFLGVTKGASDRSAQSNLTNAMTSAKAFYAGQGDFPTTTSMVADMSSAEPELHFTSTGSTSETIVSVFTVAAAATKPTAPTLVMAVWMTRTNICWVAQDTEAGGSHGGLRYAYYGTYGAGASKSANEVSCKAETVATTPPATWKTSYPSSPAGY